MKTRFLLHVVMPLVIGGVVYVCWRDPSLVMFDWFSFLGVGSVLDQLRQITLPYGKLLPGWAIYSVPDALWVYATIMFMDCIWIRSETRSFNRRLWLASGPLLVIAIELGQLAGIVHGTFDLFDIAFSGAASCVAMVFIIHHGVPPDHIKKGLRHVQANKNESAIPGCPLPAADYRYWYFEEEHEPIQ